MQHPLRTDRLELIPATQEILAADLERRSDLARLLRATIPPGWPPPLMDGSVIREFIRMQNAPDTPVFAVWYWVLDAGGMTGRTLIGSGGIIQAGERPDTVMLGYSVLDGFRNKGYATEAVRTLITEIFSLPGVRSIAATTYPDLGASIRVLEKNGFVRAGLTLSGTGAEEGTVCFLREKS